MIDDPLNRLHVVRGSEHPNAKLTEEKVREILAVVEERERLKLKLKGMTNAALARRYNVHLRNMDKIVSGETWSHVVVG